MIMQEIAITKGVIQIRLDGLDEKTIERYRSNIHMLMTKGVFETHSGKIILHFDNHKNLRKVEAFVTLWNREA